MLQHYLLARNESLGLSAFNSTYNYPVEVLGQPLPSAKLADVDGLFDRWYAALASLEIGWRFYLVGAALFAAAALGFLLREKTLWMQIRRTLLLLIFVLAWYLACPILAENCWEMGQMAERSAQRDHARNLYGWAIRLDQWNRLDDRVYQRLGAMAEADGQFNTPLYHYYNGQRQKELGQVDQALDEFSAAAQSRAPDVQHLSHMAYANTASDFALNIYRQGIARNNVIKESMLVPPTSATAASYWLKAAPMLDLNLGENFMASRALQDSGQFDLSLKYLIEARAQAGDPFLLTQIDSSLGDIDMLRGNLTAAQLSYSQSFKLLDHDKDYWNLRAIKALTDNLTLP